MRLSQAEVQEAVVEWLTRRGVSTERAQVHIFLQSTVTREHISISNVDVALEVRDVELPGKEGPYR